jgi:hypothetical protein
MDDGLKVIVTIHDEINCTFRGIQKQHLDFLNDRYALFVEGFKYMPLYQIGAWDGKIRFFNTSGITYVYLLPEIVTSLRNLGYKNIDIVDNRKGTFYDVTPDVHKDYFSHITNPKSGKPYELSDHQIEAANTMLTAGSGIALAGTGFGKAQPYSCKIMTPYGWTTMGDIKPGDLVCTPKNTIAQVLDTFEQGVTDVYKVTLQDGTFTYAHPDHLWFISNPELKKVTAVVESKYAKLTTLELKNLVERRMVWIPALPVAISLPKKELKIHPYILGSILPFVQYDNGNLSITTACSLVNYDFTFEHINRVLKPFGITLRNHKKTFQPNRISLNAKKGRGDKILSFVRKCMKKQYRIPYEYIFGTEEDRLLFLQGLCDMSGYLSSIGDITVVVAPSVALVEQVTEMFLMQGSILRLPSDCRSKTVYTIYLRHRIPDLFFLNPAKKITWVKADEQMVKDKKRQATLRTVRSVELVEQELTKCIYIDDPDHLYITDGCIITHNTILNAALVDKYQRHGCKTLTIVPAASLVTQTVKQFKILELDVSHFNSNNPSLDHDHIITTWQTLQNYPLLINEFQMVVVDECLAENTNITLANGDKKEIKDIKIGEKIISFNEQLQIFEEDEVVKVYENLLKSIDAKMYSLEFDNGEILEVTGNHLFLTNDGYVRADELRDDHEIISY